MDDEILQEFLAESWDNLGRLDSDLVALERAPDDAELLASIFRTIHTLKGTCGFLGLGRLGTVAHAGENVLGRMREGLLPVTPAAISLVLESIDLIKDLLRGLEATGREPDEDVARLVGRLNDLARGAKAESLRPSRVAVEPPSGRSRLAAAVVESVRNPTAAESPVAPAAVSGPIAEAPDNLEADLRRTVADRSIRIHVDVLDRLMNLVGELVLTRNQLLQLLRDDEESKFAAPISHLNRVTTDLQDGVMKTRMQPIGHLWSKLPRLVRDLTSITGKSIELEMSGSETELDRTVLDAIRDPLTHIVRNSADHGIEPAAERAKKGKREAGTIRLNAWHEGGYVVLSVADDGGGVRADRVLRKAIETGLVSQADATRLDRSEILGFIFRPGFSTADTVNELSGRGVGMDVVKTAIERIGGTIELSTEDGVGTTIRIRIPLTLAIIPALVVGSGGQCFSIPQLGVMELVRLAANDRRLGRIHDQEVFRLRDRLLPLVHLDRVLRLDGGRAPDGDVNIAVLQVGEDQIGLVVSDVFDTQEIVVKPVGALLRDVPIYQGTTILGDGRVIMILDAAGIAAECGLLNGAAGGDRIARPADGSSDGGATSLLLFSAGEGTMAVPLSLVARLEEFPQKRIERAGDRRVVQYRGDLLPLLPLDGRSVAIERDPQPVIVFSEGRQSMGLLVDGIEDIVAERLAIRGARRPGVLGTAIIGGRAADVLDTQHYLVLANPGWFESQAPAARRILLVDDSLFFRQLAATSLESDEVAIEVAESAFAAVERIERGERFDAIVSDLSMPMMDGFEFAEWLRRRSETANTPLVALSSLGAGANESRALQAGFDRFLSKFNPDRVLACLRELWLGRGARKGVGA